MQILNSGEASCNPGAGASTNPANPSEGKDYFGLSLSLFSQSQSLSLEASCIAGAGASTNPANPSEGKDYFELSPSLFSQSQSLSLWLHVILTFLLIKFTLFFSCGVLVLLVL